MKKKSAVEIAHAMERSITDWPETLAKKSEEEQARAFRKKAWREKQSRESQSPGVNTWQFSKIKEESIPDDFMPKHKALAEGQKESENNENDGEKKDQNVHGKLQGLLSKQPDVSYIQHGQILHLDKKTGKSYKTAIDGTRLGNDEKTVQNRRANNNKTEEKS